MSLRLHTALVVSCSVSACSVDDDPSPPSRLEVVQAPAKVVPGEAMPQTLIVRVLDDLGQSTQGVPVQWRSRPGQRLAEAISRYVRDRWTCIGGMAARTRSRRAANLGYHLRPAGAAHPGACQRIPRRQDCGVLSRWMRPGWIRRCWYGGDAPSVLGVMCSPDKRGGEQRVRHRDRCGAGRIRPSTVPPRPSHECRPTTPTALGLSRGLAFRSPRHDADRPRFRLRTKGRFTQPAFSATFHWGDAMNRPLLAVAVVAALGSAACSSPDDASGEVHLELAQAPATATPGSPSSELIIVRVVNGDGTSVPGVPVAWSIVTGGGRLRASSDTSGVDGLATAQWTPGLTAGEQRIGATLYDQPALVISVGTEVFHADKLAATFARGCGLRGTEVWCWQHDAPDQSTRRVLPQIQARDIATTYSVACILDGAGAAFCNRAFQPGDPRDYTTVPGLPPLKSIAGGGHSFCGASAADDSIWCWGDQAMSPYQLSPSVALSGLSVGLWYACGLDAGRAAWCWGLPLGSPTLVPGGHAFQSVSAQDDQAAACGIEGSAVLCWLGTTPPVRVAGLSAGQVALGWPFALFNTAPTASAGDVRVDFGPTGPTTVAVDVYDDRAFPLPVRQVYPTCVLTFDNAAYCLAVANVNEDVFPVRSYWRAIAAPPQQ